MNNRSWRTSEHGRTVELEFGSLRIDGFLEVDVIAVRREGEVSIAADRGRDHLGAPAGGHVAQPQALLPIVILHVKDVLSVRRDCRFARFAGVRDVRDGEVLKWRGSGAVQEGVAPEASGRDKGEDDERNSNQSGSMFARDGGYTRTADGGNRRRSGCHAPGSTAWRRSRRRRNDRRLA